MQDRGLQCHTSLFEHQQRGRPKGAFVVRLGRPVFERDELIRLRRFEFYDLADDMGKRTAIPS